MTSPDTIMAEREAKNSASSANVKEKNAQPTQFPVDLDPRKPAEWRNGMQSGRTMADEVNSPEYREHAARVVAAMMQDRKKKQAAQNKRRYWERSRGITLKAMLTKAFKVPTLLALPAPGQITRSFADPWRFAPHDFDKCVNRGNRRFRGYRPQWLIDAEKTGLVSGQNFQMLRAGSLYMTREQCAAYLRVLPEQVARWEEGTEQPPFAAYQCLRLTDKDQLFRRWHYQWEGWHVVESGTDAGKLYDPNYQKSYSAHEISQIPNQWGVIARLHRDCETLRSQLAAAQAENTRLRQLFLADGVTDELRGMQERLTALMSSIATAEIIDLPTTKTTRRRKAV